MKTKHKIIIGIFFFLILSFFLSDWKNFKAGLSGKPPVTESPSPSRTLN